MKKLDKKIIQKILRNRFDERSCLEVEAKNIIEIAGKLELDKDFIKELVFDFNQYFKS